MNNDGKSLENLVAFVEELRLPVGFEVIQNARVLNEEGIQIAEFDIEIRGQLGTTCIAWLIECRDRPTQGPAPASWVEQLVGRRGRFGFNKVTAVSTTGFSVGAVDFAKKEGIELREVRSLEPSELADWLQIHAAHQVLRIADLKSARIHLKGNATDEATKAAMEFVCQADGDAQILISSVSGARTNLPSAFLGAVNLVEKIFDNIPTGDSKKVSIHGDYKDDDHFLIETDEGQVQVGSIEFFGELRVEETLLPIVGASEYRHLTSQQSISQQVSFAPLKISGLNLVVGLNRMPDSGETRITLQRAPADE